MNIYIVERCITNLYDEWKNFQFMYAFRNYKDAVDYAKSWIKCAVGDLSDIDLGSVDGYNFVIGNRFDKKIVFRIKETALVESLETVNKLLNTDHKEDI